MNYQTKKCVRCMKSKPAFYAGHVLRKGKEIRAGWCENCWCRGVAGFYGQYDDRMGMENNNNE